jgi:hypothetical protein
MPHDTENKQFIYPGSCAMFLRQNPVNQWAVLSLMFVSECFLLPLLFVVLLLLCTTPLLVVRTFQSCLFCSHTE